MKVDVILGLQWGDEGKGKIVDSLSRRYDVIARFQGGPNAGHTIEFEGNKVILHTIPSGILHPGKTNVIGNGVVIDPVILMRELRSVEKYNPSAREELCISRRSHLILPVHRLMDACLEHDKGSSKIGSTLKGISPAYSDKYNRQGLRSGDPGLPGFDERYRSLTERHMKYIGLFDFETASAKIDGIPYPEYERLWLEAIGEMKHLRYCDTEVMINKALDDSKSVLAEGAQGTLLDIDFGSYPFVTSSSTICAGVCSGLGVAPGRIGKVYGVFKAYCTRVGSGPFPTELFDADGEKLRQTGHEFGSTTGRPRRCGWLDLPALRYAVMLNGVTDLVMTKADVLDPFEKIPVCTSYSVDGKPSEFMPYDLCSQKAEPMLTILSGWNTVTNRITNISQIPGKLADYINFIEKNTGIPVSFLSLSPDREKTFRLK